MPKRKPAKRDKKQNIREGCLTSPDGHHLYGSYRSKNFRFVAAFILACVGIYAFIFSLPGRFTGPINKHTAQALGLALKLIGVPVSVTGDIVTGGAFSLQIIPECTPLFMLGLFICFIVFSPATVRQKVSGLAMGIPALCLGNMVRLIAIFMAGQYDRSLFDVVHAFWGQVYTVCLVVLSFALWLKSLKNKESQSSIAAKTTSLLGRFALIACCLFFFWMEVHYSYIRLLDKFMLFGFSLFGHRFNPARENAVYFETFSIVTFTSLVLAVRSTPWKTKAKQLAGGLGFLFLTHLLHRIDNFLMVLFKYTGVLTVDLSLLLAGQYILPVLLLIYTVRRQKQGGHPKTDKLPTR